MAPLIFPPPSLIHDGMSQIDKEIPGWHLNRIMNKALGICHLASGDVVHRLSNGFKWRPQQPHFLFYKMVKRMPQYIHIKDYKTCMYRVVFFLFSGWYLALHYVDFLDISQGFHNRRPAWSSIVRLSLSPLFQSFRTKSAESSRAVPPTAAACCTSEIASRRSTGAPSSSSPTTTSSSWSKKLATSSPSLWFPRTVSTPRLLQQSVCHRDHFSSSTIFNFIIICKGVFSARQSKQSTMHIIRTYEYFSGSINNLDLNWGITNLKEGEFI